MASKESREPASVEALRAGLESAVREALGETDLERVIGESGSLNLAVELRMDRGRVLYVDAGLAFQRRMF